MPKPKKEVLLLSTKHNLDVVSIPSKRNKSKNRDNTTAANVRSKPVAIVDYNNGKCGIDKSDQMSSYRKGMKWYRKLAFELLTGTAMVNAHILYNEIATRPIKITEFREIISTSLLGLNDQRLPKTKMLVHLLKKYDDGSKRRNTKNEDVSTFIEKIRRWLQKKKLYTLLQHTYKNLQQDRSQKEGETC
ncbi:Transposase IS4 [Popillia japonica]|uniref:Transposase IS4 n=1 Tax=Popillia japonica TaxID=7064 RepID=A0AAW1LUJ5_POPJA